MALSNLFGWNKKDDTAPAAACGTACGAGDKPEEKPATTEQKESDSKTSDENKQSSKSKASSVDKKKKNTVKAGDEADPARLILLLVLSLLSMGIFIFIIKRENAKK